MRRWAVFVVVAALGAGVPSARAGAEGLGFADNSAPEFSDWTGVTLNGSPQQASMTISPFVVEDTALVPAGWHLDLTVTNLVWDDPDAGDPDFTIYADEMRMNAPTVTPVAPATMTDVVVAPAVATFGDGAGAALTQTLVTAQPTATQGFFMVALQPITVTVPAEAIAATYEGNATVDVVSGP